MITIRIPKEMKDRMKKAGLNWSLEVRRAIETKLEQNMRGKANDEIKRLLGSVRPGFESARAIREARDHA